MASARGSSIVASHVHHPGDSPRKFTAEVGVLGSRRLWKSVAELLELSLASALEPDSISSAAVVVAHCRGSQWRRASQAVLGFRVLGIQGDILPHGAALGACSAASAWDTALFAVSSIRCRGGPKVNVVATNAAMAACGRSLRWARALQMLEEMRTRGPPADIASFGAALAACGGSMGRWSAVAVLWSELAGRSAAARGIEADVAACNMVLSACRCGPDVDEAGTHLSWPWALFFFDDLHSRSLEPDVVSYGATIGAVCERQGFWARAAHLLWGSQRISVRLDDIALCAAVAACQPAGQWEQAFHATSTGSFSMLSRAGGDARGIAIGACRLAGHWEAAAASLEKLHRIGPVPVPLRSYNLVAAMSRVDVASRLLHGAREASVEMDIVSYSTLVVGFERTSRWVAAMDRLQVAEAESLQPDAAASTAVAKACERGQHWEMAVQLVQRRRHVGVRVDVTMATTVVGACERCACWHQVASAC